MVTYPWSSGLRAIATIMMLLLNEGTYRLASENNDRKRFNYHILEYLCSSIISSAFTKQNLNNTYIENHQL